MSFPNQIFVLLILVPILVQSQNTGCNSQCRRNEFCDRGRCYVDPCWGVDCGPNAKCQASNRQAVCQKRFAGGCISNSHCRTGEYCNQGRCFDDPCTRVRCPSTCQVVQGQAQCDPISGGCNSNSQCRTGEYCNQGRCFDDPCSRVRCPSTCQVVQGQAQCDPISERCNGNNERRCVDLANQGECVRNRDFMQTNCRKSCNLCNNVITGGCNASSQCRTGEYCNQGRCADDPCSRVRCATPCRVVRGTAQCDPPPESLVFDREISQGVGVGGDTQDSSQGGSNSGSFQGGNQAGVTGGANQGDAAQESNQSASSKGGNQDSGSSAVPRSCSDKSHCKDKEICDKGNCASPCDLIPQCGQGASCNVIDNGNGTRPQCICHPGTSGNPFVKCTPIQDSNRNNANLPLLGTEKPAARPAPVLGCKINSRCGTKERCQSGRCVNPCALFECGEGAKCQVSQRQPQCVCPAGTEGNPREGCKPITGNAVGATQTPSSVTNQPSTSSGTNPDISFPDEQNQAQPVQAPGNGTRLQGCETDPDPGECRGAFPRYYFNKEKNQCDCFLFGGCDIEGVKFTWPTFEECLNKCVPENTTKGSGCKRVSVDEVKEFLEQQRRDRENNGR